MTHGAKMTTLTIDMLKKAFWTEIESAPDYNDEKQYMVPDFEDEEADLLKYATLAVKHGILKVEHGDPFVWLYDGYRNQNIRFYDKKKGVVYPWSDGPDDYGTVPYQFKVGDFPPDKWSDYVDHNNYVFLREDLVEQLKATLKKVTPDVWKTTLEILGVIYPVTLTVHREMKSNDKTFTFDDLQHLDWAQFTSAKMVARNNEWAKESPSYKKFADTNLENVNGYFEIDCYI